MIGKKEKSLVAAQKLIERGQFDKAIAEFAKVVADDPKDTRTWLKMAELHAKLGANAEAAAIYVRTGEIYSEQGLSQKAVAVYKNALKLAPGVPSAHLKLATVYKQLGLRSDAAQQFELAATGFTRDGAPAEGTAALRQAVATDPDNAVLRVKLAEAASLGGLVEEAVREFGRAAEQLKALGRLDESLRVLERLLFHQPQNATKAREVAEAYIARGSPRLALPKLQACLNADPREPRTLFLLARALEQLGQKEKAVSVLKELARLFQDLGRWSEREVAVARALELAPTDVELRALAVERAGPSSLDASRLGVEAQATPPPARDLNAPESTVGGADSGRVVRVVGGATGSAGRGTGRVSLSLGVGETGGHPVSSPVVSEGGGDDVARLLAESDVFIKYELFERAAEHLGRVLAIDHQNRQAREALNTVLQRLGRPADPARHPVPPSPRGRLPALAFDVVDDDPRAHPGTPAPTESGARGLALPIPIEMEPSLEVLEFEQSISTGDVVFIDDTATGHLDGATPPPVTSRRGLDLDVTTPPPVMLGTARGLDLTTPPPVNLGVDPDVTTPPPVRAWTARGLDVLTPPPVHGQAGRGLDVTTTPPPAVPGVTRGLDADTPPPLGARARSFDVTTPPPAPMRGMNVLTPPPVVAGALPGFDATTPPPVLHEVRGDYGFDQSASGSTTDVEVDSARVFEGGPSTISAGLAIPAEEFGGAGAEDDELTEDLNQVTFFVDQGLPDEARALLSDLAERFPHDVRVTSKLRQLDASASPISVFEISGAQPMTPFADSRESTPAPRAVVEGGGTEDVSTRVDLAIAYKEMGLFDAAIAELRPLVDTKDEVLALTMMGECFEAKGSFTEAVIRYKGALNCTPISPEETMQLYFLLGAAFERLGDPSEALYFFEKVARREPRFRDVDQRILALKPKLAKAVR